MQINKIKFVKNLKTLNLPIILNTLYDTYKYNFMSFSKLYTVIIIIIITNNILFRLVNYAHHIYNISMVKIITFFIYCKKTLHGLKS